MAKDSGSTNKACIFSHTRQLDKRHLRTAQQLTDHKPKSVLNQIDGHTRCSTTNGDRDWNPALNPGTTSPLPPRAVVSRGPLQGLTFLLISVR